MKALTRRYIIGVGSGAEFSVAVDADDQVLAWGRADGGQVIFQAYSISLNSANYHYNVTANSTVSCKFEHACTIVKVVLYDALFLIT